MASMGFSYAQVHVRQERVRRRISEEAVVMTTMNKSMTEEQNKNNKSYMAKEEKPVYDSQTARRVHPCASSTAAVAAPICGHR
jgi:hypothetical protein